MTDLVVDFCSYQAAKYAVEHWHYSKSMPSGKTVKFGVWEGGNFIGAVIFAQGNNQYQGQRYNLSMMEICELARVALTNHEYEVSKIIMITVRLLKTNNDNLRCLFSYADQEQKHIGAIYQASNWLYIGEHGSNEAFLDGRGNRVHSRNISPSGIKEHFGHYSRCKKPDELTKVKLLPKHKYLYPLDKAMRRQVSKLAQPYPKREDMRAIDGNNLVSNQARRFDPDPSAIELTSERINDE